MHLSADAKLSLISDNLGEDTAPVMAWTINNWSDFTQTVFMRGGAKTPRAREPRSGFLLETSSGTRQQWVYSNNRYLYFVNGVLTTIQR